MSSPSLPSISSLQPAPRPQGFVTARSVLADLESPNGHEAEATEVIAPPEKAKRGRPKKAVNPDDDAAAKPRTRKRTTTTGGPDAGDIEKVPPKPRIRKRQGATATELEGATDAPPAPKRGRPKKAAAIDDAATAINDGFVATKVVAKRVRKKTIDPATSVEAGEKSRPPPKPRQKNAPAEAVPSAADTTTEPDACVVDVSGAVDSGVWPDVQGEPAADLLELDAAPRRRCHWTPPTESALPPSFQQSSETSPNPDSNAIQVDLHENNAIDAPPTLDFTKLIGDFAYQEDDPRPPPPLSRNSSDGVTTKRKRLDPVDVAVAEAPKKRKRKAAVPKEPKQPKEPKPKPPKKPKALKKKPLTITALATAAYLPQPDVAEADQAKLISDFFPQPQPGADTTAHAEPQELTNPQAAENKPAPKRKRAAKKVQISVPVVHIKLDSPEAARENAKRQQWLFGSSSQLAGAESPTELHELQQALKESEDMISSQHVDVSHTTSCARVASAPHGTSLSIGQANRVLWMSAARDLEDSTFASDESRNDNELMLTSGDTQLQEYPAPSSVKSAPETRHTIARSQIEVLTISSSAPKEHESPDSGFVDIDQIGGASPWRAQVPNDIESNSLSTDLVIQEEAAFPAPREIISLDTTPELEVAPRRVLGARDPNTTITKQTLDPESKEFAVSPNKLKTTRPHVVSLDSPEKRPVGRPRKVTDSAATQRSSLIVRRVVSPSPVTRADARRRFLAASPSPASPRPSQAKLHEVPPSQSFVLSPSKPRGRPPKFGPSPKVASPARPRGRPRKSAGPSALPISSQLRKLPSTPGAFARHATIVEPSSDFLDIDAISDVDMASQAPSPPRRLPDSPSKEILEFDRPPPPPLPAIISSTARCSIKQLQADWPTLAPTLFPKITQVVRSTPPSCDHKTPTWHEKILLYDPIVLEDLTSWLNAQGVRVEVMVAKAKGKKKAGDVVEEIMEMVKEELQPWMVQKWCEEHSVCCLWKEGLRGGVRQKY
ncbi:hypothetical protein E4T39_05361 [Aureobasidium subglaciale]|nr:hypothetical protein E4T39_05361 [Aureobasidium subglaciale]